MGSPFHVTSLGCYAQVKLDRDTGRLYDEPEYAVTTIPLSSDFVTVEGELNANGIEVSIKTFGNSVSNALLNKHLWTRRKHCFAKRLQESAFVDTSKASDA